jgi:uncharacterized delta-60 repeat protein
MVARGSADAQTVRAFARVCSGCAAGVLALAIISSGSPAATSGTIVGASVPSVTSIDIAGCPSTTPGITAFGLVLPGTSLVTGTDCTIMFGSSNDTASVRAFQVDRAGVAMHSIPRGSLEQSFAASGTYIANRSPGDDLYTAIARYDDDELVVAGWDATTTTFELQRIDAAGVLNTSFGSGGTQEIAAASWAREIAVRPDGRIVVAAGSGPTVFQRLPDGSSDNTWAGSGAVSIPGTSAAIGLRILGNGTVMVAMSNGQVVRINANGVLDPTYGTSGTGAFATASQIHDVAFAADGSAYAAIGNDVDMLVQRLAPDGTFDSSFATSGTLSINFGFSERARSITVDSAGRILVGGYHVGCAGSCAFQHVARLTAAGVLDPTFGSGGRASGPSQGYIAFPGIEPNTHLVTTSDGLVYAGGTDSGPSADMAVVRFSASGESDTSFGTSGRAVLTSGGGGCGCHVRDGRVSRWQDRRSRFRWSVEQYGFAGRHAGDRAGA